MCSPPGGAPETDHLSFPPDSSGASEASDEDWEPGGSECESQCHGTKVLNREDENDAARDLSSNLEDSDLYPDQTYGALLTDLFFQQRDTCNWPTGSLIVTFSASLFDDSPRDIDITPTIGHGKNVPKICNDSNCYWLQFHLNRNDEEFREKNVYSLFIRACIAAGFQVYCKYVKRQSRFEVLCCRGVYHHEDNNKKYNEKLRQKYVPRASTTKRKQADHPQREKDSASNSFEQHC